jgi:hypothetical protein
MPLVRPPFPPAEPRSGLPRSGRSRRQGGRQCHKAWALSPVARACHPVTCRAGTFAAARVPLQRWEPLASDARLAFRRRSAGHRWGTQGSAAATGSRSGAWPQPARQLTQARATARPREPGELAGPRDCHNTAGTTGGPSRRCRSGSEWPNPGHEWHNTTNVRELRPRWRVAGQPRSNTRPDARVTLCGAGKYPGACRRSTGGSDHLQRCSRGRCCGDRPGACRCSHAPRPPAVPAASGSGADEPATLASGFGGPRALRTGGDGQRRCRAVAGLLHRARQAPRSPGQSNRHGGEPARARARQRLVA